MSDGQAPSATNAPSKKVFLGGLSPTSTKESLSAYFSQYGPIIDVAVLMDPQTGNPRGFGFITFGNEEAGNAAVARRMQTIDGKEVEVKYSDAARDGGSAGTDNPKKIFVGGLPPSANKENIELWFKQFGPVTEVILPMDNMTGYARGYAFVSFESEEAAGAAMRHAPHTIEGKTVDVKHSQAKKDNSFGFGAQQPGGEARKIFVGGLRDCEEREVKEWFSQFGVVTECAIVLDRETGKSKGFGFVHFEDENAANAALVFQGHTIGGKHLDVKPSQKKQNPMMAQQQWAQMWGAYMGYPAPGAMTGGYDANAYAAAWGQWAAAAAAAAGGAAAPGGAPPAGHYQPY